MEPKITKREAVYIGRRITVNGKLLHFWRIGDDEKAVCWKKQPAPAVIGEAWSFSFSSDNSVFTSGKDAPQRVGNMSPKKSITEWAALDIAHAESNSQKLAGARLAKRESEFDRCITPLVEMMDSLTMNEDRAFFVNRVVMELWRRRAK